MNALEHREAPTINPHVFRHYDIRGLVGKDLTPEVVEAVGRSFGSTIAEGSPRPGRKVVAVGRDVRESSGSFAAAFARGLIAAGVDAIDVGVVPTPVLYFSIFHWEADGGAMITGSHNPVTYNGIKLCEGKWPIYGDRIQALRERIVEGRLASGQGTIERREVLPAYLAQLKSKFPHRLNARVVVDAGNGTAGPLFPAVLRELGCTVEELYCEPDGTFPNHLPDPEVPANVADLIRRVQSTGADAGLAFDGDADRVGLIDEAGEKVASDRLLLLFAKHLLERCPGAKVVYDVKCSEILESEIRAAGGIPIMWKTGHSLIKKKMREEGAILAGELSGHICVAKDYFGFDDAFFAALLALEIRRARGRPLGALLGEFPRTCTTHEIKVSCPDGEKFRVIDELLVRARSQGGRVIDLDGARIVGPDGWALVRASNTTPNLTIRIESRDPAGLERVAQRTEELLQAFPELDLTELRQAVSEAKVATAH
jgi:phosphomannomutase/phosphoglucomutase